jgi:sarcosine oxidase delta subunit
MSKTICKICNDTKEIEVQVMGTDFDWVECPYCSNKPEYLNFQNKYKSLVNKNNTLI